MSVNENNNGYVSRVERSARAELLISKMQNYGFRYNNINNTIEYTTNGKTWYTVTDIADITGESAYEHAVKRGYTGTETEFDINNAENTLTSDNLYRLKQKLGIKR